MPRVEATWEAPLYSSYSVLNVINPLLCWQDPHRHPAIKAFRVQMLTTEDQRTIDLGTTTDTYIPLPTDEYSISTSYKIRIATIGLELCPVMLGSAYKNKGVQLLLDNVGSWLPSPIDVDNVAMEKGDETQKHVVASEASDSLLALTVLSITAVGFSVIMFGAKIIRTFYLV